ncbi:MAG: Uridine kinase [Chlamydiae bacterium]|nr:Uridine kinase [Chlamydiota bacterium]
MLRTLFIICCLSIQALFAQDHVFIGVAGGTGSGKTTLAEEIQKAFPNSSIIISQDSYYKDLAHLPHEERAKVNFDHPNSLDFEMLKQHLLDLKNGHAIKQPVYNFHTHCCEEETRLIEPAKLIIVEGILLFAMEELRDLFDLKIFVDADDDIRILRRIERDINERSRDFGQVVKQYLTTVKPMHEAFVAPSKKYADVIFPTRGHNQVALDVILAKLHEDLEPEKMVTRH